MTICIYAGNMLHSIRTAVTAGEQQVCPFGALTSVSLSLELLLKEGLDSSLTLSLSLSLQLFCPGFSCKNTKRTRVKTQSVNVHFRAAHGSASLRNWCRNM